MWRSLLKKPQRFYEITGPSTHKQVMSHDEFITKKLTDARTDARAMQMGLFKRRDPDHVVEHVMRRN